MQSEAEAYVFNDDLLKTMLGIDDDERVCAVRHDESKNEMTIMVCGKSVKDPDLVAWEKKQ